MYVEKIAEKINNISLSLEGILRISGSRFL